MLLGLILFFETKHRSILRQGKFTTYLCGVGVGQFSSSFKHFYGSSRVSSRVFAFIIRERTMLSLLPAERLTVGLMATHSHKMMVFSRLSGASVLPSGLNGTPYNGEGI